MWTGDAGTRERVTKRFGVGVAGDVSRRDDETGVPFESAVLATTCRGAKYGTSARPLARNMGPV